MVTRSFEKENCEWEVLMTCRVGKNYRVGTTGLYGEGKIQVEKKKSSRRVLPAECRVGKNDRVGKEGATNLTRKAWSV